MAYVTEANYDARFGSKERTELLAAAGVTFSAVELDAAAEVDGYLAGRYAVPFSPVPQIVLALTADVLRYKLHGKKAPEEVQERYERAVEQLKAIRDGEQHIPGAAFATAAVTSSGGVAVEADDRVFDDCAQADFTGDLTWPRPSTGT